MKKYIRRAVLNKPLVSVIIPTYNRANFLPRAIKSVLFQTFKDFEIIIADDGSTDNTNKVVKRFNDKRIIYVHSEINKGAPTARNAGLRIANGEFIAFLDSDDEWLPEKLRKQVGMIENLPKSVGLIYTDVIRVFQRTGEIIQKNVPHFQGNVSREIIMNCFIASPTPLIRKECFQKVGGFDERLPAHQEWDMFIRILQCYEVAYVPERLAKYYIHDSQITNDINKKIQAWEIILEKHKDKFVKNYKVFSVYLNYLAKLYCLNNDLKKSRLCFIKSIWYAPLQKNSYLHMFLSLILWRKHKLVVEKEIPKYKNISLY